MTIRRKVLLAALISTPALAAFANPAVAARTASRVAKILRTLGKTSLTLATSAFAGVVSAKVMKDFEHAHDDAPAMHVIAYYALVGNKKVDDAASFWINPPEKHLAFMKTFEQLQLVDLKEVSKTPESSTVWVQLVGNQIGKDIGTWQGAIQMKWSGASWLISSMEIQKRAA